MVIAEQQVQILKKKRGNKIVFRLFFLLYFEKEIETFLNISCQIYTNEIKSKSLFQSPFVKLINEKKIPLTFLDIKCLLPLYQIINEKCF